MTIIGVDPGSTYMGIAIIDGDSVDLQRLRLAGKTRVDQLAVVTAAVHDRVKAKDSHYMIEEPPPTMRSDYQRGHQAPIGWALGRAASLVEVPALLRGSSVAFVTVRDWRSDMLIWCARRGLVLHKPSSQRRTRVKGAVSPVDRMRRLPGGGFHLSWMGCDHESEAKDLEVMTRWVDAGGCPECRTPKIAKAPRDITDEWKRIACEATKRFHPVSYERLVVEAKKAARTTRPDHRLSGVSDACEALWIGMSLKTKRGVQNSQNTRFKKTHRRRSAKQNG